AMPASSAASIPLSTASLQSASGHKRGPWPICMESSFQIWKRSSDFTQRLLPDFMNENPQRTKDWDVVYDARGRLTEPHTGIVINLGTREVREYIAAWMDEAPALCTAPFLISTSYLTKGPAHRYRFALFVEKEGFAPLIAKANLASRFDIAIMS